MSEHQTAVMTVVPTALIEGNLSILQASHRCVIPAREVTGLRFSSLFACPSRQSVPAAAAGPRPLPDHSALLYPLSTGWPVGLGGLAAWLQSVSYLSPLQSSSSRATGRDVLISTVCAAHVRLVKTPVAPSRPRHVDILAGRQFLSRTLNSLLYWFHFLLRLTRCAALNGIENSSTVPFQIGRVVSRLTGLNSKLSVG